jgi:hypothetical protein
LGSGPRRRPPEPGERWGSMVGRRKRGCSRQRAARQPNFAPEPCKLKQLCAPATVTSSSSTASGARFPADGSRNPLDRCRLPHRRLPHVLWSASSLLQRVPRSQISRAHPAHNAGGFGERTSAVLSALSADDETALSAAEAAGEHTSERQEARGGRAEAQGEAAAAGAASTMPRSASGPVAVPQQQQPANSLTAPAPRRHEMAGSPPACTSPVYRANSVVSHTAVPHHKAQQQQQQQQQQWRGGETPLSAPAPQNLGSSPNGSRGEVGFES